MVRTQIQLPDELYAEVKRIAREREMSLAEVVRRAVELIARVYPPVERPGDWAPPAPRRLGSFLAPVEDWRMLANEPLPDEPLPDEPMLNEPMPDEPMLNEPMPDEPQ